MFNVNQFIIVGKFKIIKTLNNITYIYLVDNNNYDIKCIVDDVLISKIKEFVNVDDYIGIKGYIINNNDNINLYATKIFFFLNIIKAHFLVSSF